jgi:hypothetical protein
MNGQEINEFLKKSVVSMFTWVHLDMIKSEKCWKGGITTK